jgi:hypothetical protein
MYILPILILISICNNAWADDNTEKELKKKYNKCWTRKGNITLLDTIQKAMSKKILEDEYSRHDFIQTFGCAYEENDLQQNSIRAVYRAIIQSIRNRNLELRDNLTAVLQLNPPRPDNLMRDYSIYVNIPLSDSTKKAARYEVKILDIVAVPTIESAMSIWTRIVTRLAYKEDYNNIKTIINNESEFVKVMLKAQTILESVEKSKLSAIKKLIDSEKIANVYPQQINDLSFGDSMFLFDENNPKKTYLGIYLGKGIFVCETQKDGMNVCKFGEERLYGLRIDTNSFRRTTTLFAELNYQAPEIMLECLFLRNSVHKPQFLPPVMNDDPADLKRN